jgi:hypothetical protein
MREDGDVAGHHKIEEEMLHPHRGDMMGRFDENIARVSQRQKAPGPEPGNKIRRHVHICTSDKTKGNALPIQGLLQCKRRLPDLWAGVMVEPRQDVRRAGDNGDPVGDVQLCHLHRDAPIGCTVIDAGENMAVEIDHVGKLRVVGRIGAWVSRQIVASSPHICPNLPFFQPRYCLVCDSSVSPISAFGRWGNSMLSKAYRTLLVALLSTAMTANFASAATVMNEGGSILASTGEGFKPIPVAMELPPGAQVMVKSDGLATISYGSNCSVRVGPGLWLVQDKAPCKDGATVIDFTGQMGDGMRGSLKDSAPPPPPPRDYSRLLGAIFIGGIIACVAFCDRDNDHPASP